MTHSFLPGDDVPEWARKLITNPHAWEADTADEPDSDDEDSGAADLDDSEAGGESDPVDTPTPAPDALSEAPAKTGPGASRQKWADFAAANGVEVDQSWKREDIIAACEKAGLA